MICAESKITSKSQITIPKVIRKSIGIKNGDRILFICEGDHISLRKIDEENYSILKLAESSFSEWDNEEDEVYNDL